jgi:tetratricopeptide (TPR) repeat protein
MLGLGALMVLLAGWPFWLIGFSPSLNWPASRFTLPFMFGVALIFAGLISSLPWRILRIVLLVSIVSMAAGKQYLTSHAYAQDWETQKDLFWQMTWRAPSIEADTLVLMNEGAFDYYADNSLSAALNWIYAPENHSSHVEYLLFYPTTRFKNALPDIEPELPIYYDYLAGEFNGNTSQTLSFYYAPPGCLRLLDSEVERLNRLIPENSLMRYAARLTVSDLILEEPRAEMPVVYGPEPEHGFCYYYQKADLARQFGRWEQAAEFSDIALSFEDHPYEPAEHLLFIEGYAHVGQWEGALELSERVYEVSPEVMGRVLCQLWERIEAETDEGPGRAEALDEVKRIFRMQSMSNVLD